MTSTLTRRPEAEELDGERRHSTEGTVLPRLGMPSTPPAAERRVEMRAPVSDQLNLVGAAAAAVALTLLLSAGFGMVTGAVAWLVAYLWFIAVYALLTSVSEKRSAVVNNVWMVLLWTAGLVMLVLLGLVLAFVVTKGWRLLLRPTFWTYDMNGVGPLTSLDQGGVFHAILATLEQIGMALAVTVPLSLLTATLLNEVGGRFARLVRTVTEAMTALPSVVAGLFIYAALVMTMHQFSGFAAAMAIAVLMLPIMIRSADTVLRLVPGNLREAGYALGASQWRVVRMIVLPTVRSGLATAIILGTAHGIGETAPVMLTAGFTNNLNINPWQESQTPLPFAALHFIKGGMHNDVARGYATATVLLVLVLVLFLAARVIGGQEAGHLTPRQQRARARRSQQTLARIIGRDEVS